MPRRIAKGTDNSGKEIAITFAFGFAGELFCKGPIFPENLVYQVTTDTFAADATYRSQPFFKNHASRAHGGIPKLGIHCPGTKNG